jgi:hypothetical protein
MFHGDVGKTKSLSCQCLLQPARRGQSGGRSASIRFFREDSGLRVLRVGSSVFPTTVSVRFPLPNHFSESGAVGFAKAVVVCLAATEFDLVVVDSKLVHSSGDHPSAKEVWAVSRPIVNVADLVLS